MGKIMNKVLHQVWVQGEDNLPDDFRRNRELWRQDLEGFEMILWDNAMACERWPDYAAIQHLCSHHAMRADLILARALRDIGGVTTGTDVIPNNIPNFLDYIGCNDTMIVANPSGRSASNGLSYFKHTGHPFIKCVCNHQLRDISLLSSRNVWAVTGPRCWWEALVAHHWDLNIATDMRAFTKLYSDKEVRNKLAWVDAGYAGSWH